MRGCNQTAVKKLVLRRGRGGVIGGFNLRRLCHVDKMRQISIAGQIGQLEGCGHIIHGQR